MTAPMPQEELLPCPFCGGAAIVEEVPTGLGAGGVSFSVGCDSPDEVACMGYQNLQTFSRRSEAIAGWNKRDPAVAQSSPSPSRDECYHALMGLTSYVLANFKRTEQWTQGGCLVVKDARDVLAKHDEWDYSPDESSNQGASK